MTELQALTICRDAVQRSKGVSAGLWFDGPDRHCTIGAISQVGLDVGFPMKIAKVMTARLQAAIPMRTKSEIVTFTDSIQHVSRETRRTRVLNWLNDKIAKLTEHSAAIADSPKELLSGQVQLPSEGQFSAHESTKVPVVSTRLNA
jgi:hypothetical protein